eukprot:gene10542-10702_t
MLRLASAAAPVVSLFVQAATLQLAGRENISDKHQVQKEIAWDCSSGTVSDHTQGAAAAAAGPRNVQQQQPWQQEDCGFTAGLWISSWGASNGLKVQDATEIWQKLHSVGCQLSSCSYVQCFHPVDLNPLRQLTGLKSLGLTMQGPIKKQPPDDLAAVVHVGHDTWQQNIAALTAIAELKDSLQELSIDGCPLGGFRPPSSPPIQQQVRKAQAQYQLHPLASLTGLTKLSLLKEWIDPAMELFPLAFLTQLQELTIERMGVDSQAELRCLGNLRQLKSMDIDSPVLLDWSWLKQLQQLEVARLTVPHLDLACLPSSLVELDVQQRQDRPEVSPTITGGSGFVDGPGSSHSYTCGSSSTGSGARVHLPRLKKLTLPRPLVVARRRLSTAEDTISCSAAVEDDDDGGGGGGSDGDKVEGMMDHEILWMHQSCLLLLALAAGCPELRSLDLLQWQLPTGIVLAAVNRLQYLSWLSLCQPDTVAGEELKLHLAAMLEHAASLPSIAPRGSYSMRLQAADVLTGQELFCLDVWFRIG